MNQEIVRPNLVDLLQAGHKEPYTMRKFALGAALTGIVFAGTTQLIMENGTQKEPGKPDWVAIEAAKGARERTLGQTILNGGVITVLNGTIVEQYDKGTQITNNPIVVDNKPETALGHSPLENPEKYRFYSAEKGVGGEIEVREIDFADTDHRTTLLGSGLNKGGEVLWSGTISVENTEVTRDEDSLEMIVESSDPKLGGNKGSVQTAGETSFQTNTMRSVIK